MVEKEKSEKLKLQQMIHVLQDEVQNLEASVSSKAKLQSSSTSENQHEVHQTGIFAKTWGFLQDGPFHASKSKELDTAERGRLILGKRPKTRGEQRTKFSGGDPLEGKRSKPRSPPKPTNKKAIETSKGLIQNHPQGGELYHCPASEASSVQDDKACIVEKPTVADEAAQTLSTIEHPQLLSPSRLYSDDNAQKANPDNFDRSQNNNNQLLGIAASEVDEHCQSRDTVAKLVESMINTQECLHNKAKQITSNDSQEQRTDGSAQASLGSKVVSSVLVPRLNLHQVGGHPHRCSDDNNSERSSNAHQTPTRNSNLMSFSTLNAFEQSHQKVIAWDDNMHRREDQLKASTPVELKLAIIPESINQ